MAKKGFGKFVVLAAAAGAAAAGISYLRKYKSFNDELEEEFHDFEGGEENDDDLFEEEEIAETAERYNTAVRKAPIQGQPENTSR